jgi:hypothetical protein
MSISSMWSWLLPRLHFPSIKEYNFCPKINENWGQYVVIDEPSYLYFNVDEEDRLWTTFCCDNSY